MKNIRFASVIHVILWIIIYNYLINNELFFAKQVSKINSDIVGDFNYTMTPLTIFVYCNGKSFKFNCDA